jgi:hypothetical protein
VAALFLRVFGLVAAGGAAFVLSYLLVFVGCKIVARRPHLRGTATR